MKNKMLYAISVLFSVNYLLPLFEHDQAIHSMQKGNPKIAWDTIQQAVVHNPDDPILLYDAGIIAYTLEQFAIAQNYFQDAAVKALKNSSLEEQALYNAGNAAYKQQEYDHAISYYEAVLAINSQNEYAQHNIAKIKELQKNQENKSDSEQQNENSQEKNSPHKDQQKQDQKKQSDDQKKNKEKEQSTDQNKQDKNEENGPEQDNTSNESDMHKEDKKTENKPHKDQQKKDNKQDEDKSNSLEEQNDQDQSHEKDKQKNSKKDSDAMSEKSKSAKPNAKTDTSINPETENVINGMANDQEGNQLPEKEFDALTTRFLSEQEQKDKEANARMIRSLVNSPRGGANEEYSW